MLIHLPDQIVDLVFTVAEITTLNVVLELPLPKATIRTAELKRPQEVAGLFEVRADGVNLMDQILHTHDAVLAQVLFHKLVIRQRNTLGIGTGISLHLAVPALVDQLTHALEVGVAVGDEGLDDLEHLGRGLGQADEDARVDLQQAEQLQRLALLRVDLVDALDAHDVDELRLGLDVVVALLLGGAAEADLFALRVAVFFHVGFGAFEDDAAFFLVGL